MTRAGIRVGVAIGHAVPGRSHVRRGAPCEDVVLTAEGPVTVAVVADGAGSARHARRGAEVVAGAVLAVLRARLHDLLAGGPLHARDEVLGAADRAIADEAARLATSPRELASTLLFAAVARDRFLVGHLGDGIVGVRRDGRTELLSEGARGEHANETVFVPTRSGPGDLRLYVGASARVDGFVLLTDGAADGLWGVRSHLGARAPSPVVDRWWTGLDTALPCEVEQAIADGLEGPLRQVTRDDCAVAIVRRVGLGRSGTPRARDLLGGCGRRALRVRARVARSWDALGAEATVGAIARRSRLSEAVVAEHVSKLRRLGWG